jgi:3-methyladenine DNA glycosylase AlkD
MIDEKDKVTDAQLESWVLDFDTWDICDQTCDNLISDSKFAYKKAFQWAARSGEFVRRAGFTLMAMIGWYGKGCSEEQILAFLPLIEKYATDERNFVKKAVNWALRNIGKARSMRLHAAALKTARLLEKSASKSARWIAKDAIRELTSEKKLDRLKAKDEKNKKQAKA